MMEKINMFGKVYNCIGSTDSNFIIKTKGDLKIQRGNVFLDLLPKENQIFFSVDSQDDINKDGIYIVSGEEVWINIKGIKLQLQTIKK